MSLIAWAIAFTASKSPFDEAAKPASMTSTLQPLELARDAQLLVLGHRGAGRLLAVAQGGVEDDQLVGRSWLSPWVESKTARCFACGPL